MESNNMKKFILLVLFLLAISCKKDPLAEIRALASSKDIKEKEQASAYYAEAIDTLVKAYSSLGVLNKDLGRKLMLKEQFTPALKHLNIAKDVRNDDAWIYYWIGVSHANIYKIEKNYESLLEAKKNYKIAINLKPEGKEFLYALAQLLVFGTEEYKSAVELLKKYVYDLKTNDPGGYFLLGRSYYILGQYEEAYRIYNELLQLKNKLTKEELSKLHEFIETTRRKLNE